ncbi:MSLNL protein, partial [Rhagologus leucostigma]|nr:MSLNL protein [Rhagologus leucostigma]
AQLSCLARLLAAKNLTADFGSFPPDLLLFFHPSEVAAGTCREFYARASRGNLDLLPRGSSRRTRLLRGALTCLVSGDGTGGDQGPPARTWRGTRLVGLSQRVRGSRLEPQQLGSLGALVCDLEPGTIPASAPAILENLKLCPALTGAQQDALNALLLTGNTAYGDPSSWDLGTLRDLGPLVLALNQTTLSLVAEAVREDFRRSVAAAYSSQGHSQREKSLILLRAFAAASAASQPRLKRSEDGCPSEPITADSIPLLTPEQLDLCLSSQVLIDNLEAVLEQPITVQSSKILKKKVDQLFPSGIPEKQLKRLGMLSRLYTEQEISQWSVTSSDTLSALLNTSGGEWEDSQVQQLLSRFLALGGSLTGPLLRQIGDKRLRNLREEQIQQIPAEAIRTAGQLNISLYSQTKKELLYRKAREAFASLASTPGPYYCRIQPYLGGAPAEDLKDLANAGVAINMDLDTFLALNPEELQKLSVTDVKNLLGENLPKLKEAENEPSVVSWVKIQSQRELDCVLGIGLQGGLQEPTGTTTPARPTTPASITSTATVPTPARPTTPASVTSTATVPTPARSTTPASITSTATVPTPARPTTSASVTPVPATLTTIPTTSASVTPVPATLTTIPTTSASVTSLSTV